MAKVTASRIQHILSVLRLSHAQRLDDLIGMSPLYRKPIDSFLEAMGLVEEYDKGYFTNAVQLTALGYVVTESINWIEIYKSNI